MLHNTATPTTLRAGQKDNVIPGSAAAEIDGRMLPGIPAAVLMREVEALLPEAHLSLELLSEQQGTLNHPHGSSLWRVIQRAVGDHDPRLTVIPYMLPAFTDGSHFSKLGARWYGFSPVWSDPEGDFNVSAMPHAVDERIPEDGFHWGLALLYEVVRGFCAVQD